MDIECVKAAIDKWASEKPLILRVFIFGSRARDDYRADSDLDLAIELDLSQEWQCDDGGIAAWIFDADIDAWKRELEATVPYAVQIEHYNGDGSPIIAEGLQRSSLLAYQKRLGIRRRT